MRNRNEPYIGGAQKGTKVLEKLVDIETRISGA